MSKKRWAGLIILVILGIVAIFTYIRIQDISPFQERSQAATAQEVAFAENEYDFINQIYLKYIGGKTTDQLTATYDDMYNHYASLNGPNWTFTGAPSRGVYNDWYRTFCSMATVNAIAKEGNLTPTDPFVQYFNSKYNSGEFRTILDLRRENVTINGQVKMGYKKAGGWHVRAAAGYDCLIAASAMRHTLGSIRNTVVTDLAYFTRELEKSIIQDGIDHGYGNTILNYYQKEAQRHKGDSQAEEALAVASLLNAASQILPSTGSGAITADERTKWRETARDLAAWGITQSCSSCSLQHSSNWLLNNHEMSPNPNYTLSLLTGYSELALAYRQLGRPLPSDIFNSTLANALTNIGQNLDGYLSSTFGFKGAFNLIHHDGTVYNSHRFDAMKYTLQGSQISSSINTLSSVDSMNQYVIPGTDTLKSYIQKGDRMWSFTCDLGDGNCDAAFQNSSLSEWFAGVQRKANNADGWNTVPLPTRVDTVTQWFRDNTTLYTYVYSGDRVWHFICSNIGGSGQTCTAEYTKTLSNHWPATIGSIPRTNIDAISEFVTPGTNTIKGYLFEGNRMYAYSCDRTNYPGSCTAFYNNTLPEFWSGVNNGSVTPWSPPTDAFDSIHQYYDPAGNLKTYVYRGGNVWSYSCNTGGCAAMYTQSLAKHLESIHYQWKWPQFAQSGINQIVGVADWGMDATFQNSGYASLYLVNNAANYDRYNRLQQEQMRRGRNNSTLPFPSEFTSGAWNYNALTTTRNAGGLMALTDGWSPAQTPERKINAHWWLNFLAGKNHSMAYLALTDKKILGTFDEPAPTNSPTRAPTATRAPTPTITPTRPSCTDSDGGNIPGTAGSLTVGTAIIRDVCNTQTEILTEYFCSTTSTTGYSSATHTCQYGCGHMACAPQPPTATPTPGTLSDFTVSSPISRTVVNADTVTLRWNASAGASSYDWLVLPEGGRNYSTSGTTTGTSVTIPLKAGRYMWQITARNATSTRQSNLGEFIVSFVKKQPLTGTFIVPANDYTFKWRPLNPLYENLYLVIYNSSNTIIYISPIMNNSSTNALNGTYTTKLDSTTSLTPVTAERLTLGQTYRWNLVNSSGIYSMQPADAQQSFTLVATLPTNTPTLSPTRPAATNTPAPTCTLKQFGDADCNNVVDLIDFACWKGEFAGNRPSNCRSADFNSAGGIDILDFTIWKINIGRRL